MGRQQPPFTQHKLEKPKLYDVRVLFPIGQLGLASVSEQLEFSDDVQYSIAALVAQNASGAPSFIKIGAGGGLLTEPSSRLNTSPLSSLPQAFTSGEVTGGNTPSLVIPSAGANTRLTLVTVTAYIFGSGTSPTIANPTKVQIKDGNAVIMTLLMTAFGQASPTVFGPVGLVITAGNALSVVFTAPLAANNTGIINVVSGQVPTT